MNYIHDFWLWVFALLLAASPVIAMTIVSYCARVDVNSEYEVGDGVYVTHSEQWADDWRDLELEILAYMILYNQTRQVYDKDIDWIA